jgi:predicted transcriptional regulator
MSEIDVLLARFIEKHIDSELGVDTTRKIKERLAKKGFSFAQAIKKFEPFEQVLRESFGKGADGMLKRIFNNIWQIKPSKEEVCFVIKDRDFANMILGTYGHKEKGIILEAVSESTLSIAEILKKLSLPQSTGYRLISSLIKEGFLIETGQDLTAGGKPTYKSTISTIDIKIQKSVEITVHFSNEVVKNSHIVAIVGPKK